MADGHICCCRRRLQARPLHLHHLQPPKQHSEHSASRRSAQKGYRSPLSPNRHICADHTALATQTRPSQPPLVHALAAYSSSVASMRSPSLTRKSRLSSCSCHLRGSRPLALRPQSRSYVQARYCLPETLQSHNLMVATLQSHNCICATNASRCKG